MHRDGIRSARGDAIVSRDIPIIFSAPMVQALLDGRKTMTRRLAWRDAGFGLQYFTSEQIEETELKGWNVVGEGEDGRFRVYKPTAWQRVRPGDRLWVREAFAIVGSNDPGMLVTRADYPSCVPKHYENVPLADQIKWRPSIHMPRSASRLTLTVSATKIERVQSASDDDIDREGALTIFPATVEILDLQPPRHRGPEMDQWEGEFNRRKRASFVDSWRKLWTEVHGVESWNANPEVVALAFTVAKRNIDAKEAA
jgi:hypothetical protein